VKRTPMPIRTPRRFQQRARVSSVALLGALALLSVAAPLRAQTAAIAVRCPTGPVDSGTAFESAVSIDVGAAALGAYTVDVAYDPAVIAIDRIGGGTAPEFSGAPQANPDSFGSGLTRVSAFQNTSLESPTGTVDVMRITFTVGGAAGSCDDLRIVPQVVGTPDGQQLLAEPGSCGVTVGGVAPLPARDGASACTGDCNGDQEVTIVELLRGMNIVLGTQGVCRCRSFDDNGDGAVTVDEIVQGVNGSLDGCPMP